MKRDVARMAAKPHDLLVIGAGISGAAIAWDAALRGLDVVLVDRGDFGGATSANSLKTVHGGLRYLQDLDLTLVRGMVAERRALLRIAPHLVRPLPVLMPTRRDRLARSKLVLGGAITLNDLASFDRNRGVDPARRLPAGRILSRRQLLSEAPGLDNPHFDGGVVWHDAQIHNTERLTLAFVQSASAAGALVANHASVVDLLRDGPRVVGARISDGLTGQTHEVLATTVINAAGPWADLILDRVAVRRREPLFNFSSAINLVTRQVLSGVALGVDSEYTHHWPDGRQQRRTRVLFIAPWRGYSLVGTLHQPFEGSPDALGIPEATIESFLDEVNRAYPGARLERRDVYHLHRGLLPRQAAAGDPEHVKLVRTGQVIDHEVDDGISGLISVIGVKYTTGRDLAEKVLGLVFRKLGRSAPDCHTTDRPLHGGDIPDWGEFVARMNDRRPPGITPRQMPRLLANYGSNIDEVFQVMAEDPSHGRPLADDTQVTPAEVIVAARYEMAEHLADVVFGRTELGTAGLPGPATLAAAARVMAAVKGWDEHHMELEVAACRDAVGKGGA